MNLICPYLEDDLSLVESSLPGCPGLAGDGVLPHHEVHGPVGVLHRSGNIPERGRIKMFYIILSKDDFLIKNYTIRKSAFKKY